MKADLTGEYGAFQSALWALVLAVLERYPRQLLSVHQVTVPRFRPPNRIDWEPVTLFDARHVIGSVVDDWARAAGGWAEFEAVLAEVESNPDLRWAYLTDAAGQPLSDPAEQGHWWLAYSIRNFLYDYFGAANPGASQGDKDCFDRLFVDTATSIRTRKHKVVYWAPLYNCEFVADIAPQPFDEIVIEEPPGADLAAFAGPLVFEPVTLVTRFPSHFLRIERDEDLKGPEYGGVDQAALKRCATAIRLVLGGNARVREIFARPAPGFLRGLGQPGLMITSYSDSWWQTTRVMPESLTDIAEVWNGLTSVELNHPIPLRRYILTSERMEAEDRLIDATIGLEGLLLSDRPAETAAIFALRGAWLLGATTEERATWQRKLSDIYNVRSRVIHANAKALSKKPQQVADAQTAAVDILGNLIRRLALERHDARAWEALVASGPLG